MKQAIRYFSLGLLLSVLLLYGYQFFNKENRAASFSKEELIALVEDEGYHVITNEEYITYSLNKDNPEEKQEEAKENEEKADKEKDKKDEKNEKSDKDEDDEEDEVVKASIKVDGDTYIPDIADNLIDKKIIDEDDGEKFSKYMDENDYSDYVQLGTFKVDSDMSIKELAETFTTYPGD